MLLIYPPATKPSEPPAGIILLATTLKTAGLSTEVWDANLEAFYWTLDQNNQKDRKNALMLEKTAEKNVQLLRNPQTYTNLQKYRKAVTSLNNLMNLKTPQGDFYSLGNYTMKGYSPLDSKDLNKLINQYEESFFTPFYRKGLKDFFSRNNWKDIGISLQFINQALPAMALIGLIKKEFPSCRIVLGGGLITSWLRTGYNLQFLVDAGCILIEGKGEEKLLTLLNPDHKRQKNNEIELHGLEKSPYLSPGLTLPVSFSTGCFYRKCTFCPETAEKSPYTTEIPKKIVPVVNAACIKYKPALIHILDNEISPFFLEFLSQNSLDAPWYGFTRFYNILKDPEFCKSLASKGCRMLKLGLESGNQMVLDTLGKGQKVEDTEIILENLKQAGILTFVYIMFGTPAENKEKAEETLAYCIKNSRNITFLNCSIFNLPIASELHKQLKTSAFYSGDLALYENFEHPEGWERKKVRQWLSHDFKKHPTIAPIIERTPYLFNANHGVFFNLSKLLKNSIEKDKLKR